MLSTRDIFTVTGHYPNKDGTDVEQRHLGKFYHDGERVAVLEDHSGILHNLPDEGPLDDHAKRTIRSLMSSQYLHVQSVHDRDQAAADEHGDLPTPPDLSPSETAKPARPAVFDYRRAGMHSTHTLEVVDGRTVLDGAQLSPEESARILEQVRTGLATLRHRKTPGLLQKQEDLMDLLKSEIAPGKNLAESMEHLRGLVAAGHLPQEHYDRVRQELFQDHMTPVGNKRALSEHLARPQGGAYASLDGNGIRGINAVHGHPGGDAAIVGMGNSIRRAIDKTAGDGNVKAFRAGGDEFVLHGQHPEHLHQVLRQLRSELESIPAIGGTHRLSMSAGLGSDYPSADRSLYAAKTQKEAAMRAVGRDPSDHTHSAPHSLYAHSLIPGSEGAIPTEIPHPLHHVGLSTPAPVQMSPSPAAGPQASAPATASTPKP